MHIEQLKQQYERARCTDSVGIMLDFKNDLMSEITSDILDYHYGLLVDKSNYKLYQILRAAFAERGPVAEVFLLNRIKVEQSAELRNDAVQILGAMGSREVAPIARNLIDNNDEESRSCGCIVLGWVGTGADICILSKVLESDSKSSLRAHAAAALRQLWLRHPDTKDRILQILGKALSRESEINAIKLIVVALQSILSKNFGLRENMRENTLTGDVGKAKLKAINYLAENM